MFKIRKDAIDRRVDIMMQGIPSFTGKITEVTDDEVIGVYADGEIWHINQAFIMGWTFSARKEVTQETKDKIKAKRLASKSL